MDPAQKLQSSYPAEVRKWNFSPFYSAKGVVKFGLKFWWNFPCYVFQGLGFRGKLSPKFHAKNGVKNGKFHAIFTLLGRGAEKTLCLGFLSRPEISLGRTPRGSCNRTLLRRVLRRFSNNKSKRRWSLESAGCLELVFLICCWMPQCVMPHMHNACERDIESLQHWDPEVRGGNPQSITHTLPSQLSLVGHAKGNTRAIFVLEV